MGRNLICGCRVSMGSWFLCKKHRNLIEDEETEQEIKQAITKED